MPILVQHICFKKHTAIVVLQNTTSGIALKLFWFILLALLMFRHTSMGNDTLVYKDIFEYIATSSWSVALRRSPEIAWTFVCKLISTLGGDFRWVIVLSAILGVWWIAKAYIKYSTDASLTIAIFIITPCFILLFSGLRQSIAISLGFIAFEFVRQKKIVPFLLVVVIAVLFHTSAFMIIFMYPLYHLQIKKEWLFFIIPLLFLVFIFNQQIFVFLGFLLSQFTDYETTISLTGSFTMLILFAIFAIFSFIFPDEKNLDADTIGMRNFLLLTVALQMFAPLHTLAMRMNYYYITFIPILLPRIISHRSVKWEQIGKPTRYILVAFFVTYFFVTAPTDNLLHTFPYHFFWETSTPIYG